MSHTLPEFDVSSEKHTGQMIQPPPLAEGRSKDSAARGNALAVVRLLYTDLKILIGLWIESQLSGIVVELARQAGPTGYE
jgi:hypothetical protein